MKINDAYQRFIEMMLFERNASLLTIECYKKDLSLFINFVKKENAEDLQINDLKNFISELSCDGKAATTIIRRAGTVKQFMFFLQKENIININTSSLAMPKRNQHLPDVLSTEEVEEIFSSPDMNKDEGKRDRAMLEIMYASGMRVSELINLKLKQVNIDLGILKIIGKGSKERHVPIGDFAKEYLLKYLYEVRGKYDIHRSQFVFLIVEATN